MEFCTFLPVASREHILFVCTGNTCRSPMAEGLFRELIGKTPEVKERVSTGSAGVSASKGMPASIHSVKALAARGINLTPHRSRPLTGALIEESTLILAMTRDHRDTILAYFPEADGKIHLLGDFSPNQGNPDISDPFGGSPEQYLRCCDQISQALSGVLRFINQAK